MNSIVRIHHWNGPAYLQATHKSKPEPDSLELWYNSNTFGGNRERRVWRDGAGIDRRGGRGRNNVGGWSRGRGHERTPKSLV